MCTHAALDPSRAAACFRALSDETRLGIVAILSRGERCVCELMDDLDVPQSLLSFHLKVLKDAGLVTDRREGRWSYYSLDGQKLDEVSAAALALKPRRRVREGAACCA